MTDEELLKRAAELLREHWPEGGAPLLTMSQILIQ
jgi:hypothetical protein